MEEKTVNEIIEKLNEVFSSSWYTASMKGVNINLEGKNFIIEGVEDNK